VFCPVCEAEYVEGITHCPEDDVELVEELVPPERPRRSPPSDLVVVHRLTGQPELGEPRTELIRAALEENGIPVAISGEFELPRIAYGTALGPPVVEILVSPADAGRAREIIAEVEGSLPVDGTPADETGEEDSGS
jgi:hypothetical protein